MGRVVTLSCRTDEHTEQPYLHKKQPANEGNGVGTQQVGVEVLNRAEDRHTPDAAHAKLKK